MQRLFLAAKIHPNACFYELYQSLRKELTHEKIRWVDINNLHLTLKFFGETDESKVAIIDNFMQSLLSAFRIFDFRISDLGIFGSRYQPKVIWLGTAQNEYLIRLAEQVLNELARIGYERDRQNFVPHLTLGRINSIGDKPGFDKAIQSHKIIDIQKVEVTEIILFESVLQKTGPVYKVVRSYKL
jgi:RNA 2',3'-cyclic 3'-phosphodiesterase